MIKVIAFDADDTLWVNEPYFRASEEKFCALMGEYMSEHDLERELLKVEIANIGLYGYGIKGFILSMMEAALQVSGGTINAQCVEQILALGRQMLNQPIELLEGVEEVLSELKGSYRLVVATKGDLLDQERKLKKSGLTDYFHHVEIMSEKDEPNYRKLLKHLDIQPEEFLMIGNSLKSDVLPVLNIGGHAIHVPFHITWAHEQIEGSIDNERFKNVAGIREVLVVL